MNEQYVWNDIDTVFHNDLEILHNIQFNGYRKSANNYGTITLQGESLDNVKVNVVIDMGKGKIFEYWENGYNPTKTIGENFDTYFCRALLKIVDYTRTYKEVLFWSRDVSNDDQEGKPKPELTDNLIITHINSDFEYREKKQIRPTDHSQEWIDTDEYRKDPNKEPEVNSCQCTNTYNWVQDGTICNGVNLCRKEKMQVRNVGVCHDGWKDYFPLVYRIGEVLQYDSDECGTTEYKEEWSEPVCGSEINLKYPNSRDVDATSKYKVLVAFIKRKTETEWKPIECGEYINVELIKQNSFECGWFKEERRTIYDDNLCGGDVKVKYPDIPNIIDNHKYKIGIIQARKTLPFPTNNDNMTEDQWVWSEWENLSEYISNDYGGDCDCGFKVYEYRNSGRHICGSALTSNFTIIRTEGNWLRQGNTFTSNDITHREVTIERIYFTANSSPVEIRYDQSSEYSYDYLTVSKVDHNVNKSPSSNDNYWNAQGKTSGSFVMTVPTDGKEHFIEMMYQKDSSNDNGRDNVIVTFLNSFDSTSSYEVWEKWEICTNTNTGEEDYRNGVPSCECGYRIYDYKVDSTIGYEYVCGDDINKDSGYMYYKEYKYEQCEDGSNFKWHKDDVRYIKANHSTDYTCIYDPDTKANTTKQTFRTFFNENTKAYEAVMCPNKIIISTIKKSSDCGWKEQWIKVGEVCCGELENTGEAPTLTITRVEGDWIREGNTFTSNKISHNQSTIEKIYFTCNKAIKIDYDQSSENSYDYAYIYNIDSESSVNTNLHYLENGSISLNVPDDGQEHFIKLKYQKDGSNDKGRDNVIITLSPDRIIGDCIMYSKYNKDEYQYSTNGGETWISLNPPKYRYGDQIEYNSEKCGYVPRMTHWDKVCDDITYETAQVGDGCVICEIHNGAPTMFAIEKEQYSLDGGTTWHDIIPLKIRTENQLKWKAEKCGYTGDTFETRYTNEVCENGDLYGDSARWVSSDNGQTWIKIEGSEKYHVLMEKNSDKCKQPPIT